MASKDKTFYYYFKENMNNIIPGVGCPESMFGKLSTAVATIGAMSDYVHKNHTGTVRDVVKGVPVAVAAAEGGTVVGWAGVISKSAVGVAELAASFYVGACIGSLFVAAMHSYSDFSVKARAANTTSKFDEHEFYSVSDISAYAKRYKIAMSHEVQKALHKNYALCKDYVR